jgi:hypothetical protein
VDRAGAEEEILDTGRPGGRRRVALGLGLVLAAGALIGGLVAARGRGDHHQSGPVPNPAPTSSAAPALPLVAPGAADTIGDTIYLAQHGALATVDVNTGALRVWQRLPSVAGAGGYRVIADGRHHQVFVVSAHGDVTDVGWFDGGTLEQPGQSEVPGRFGGAALLDGLLYVSTSTGVVVVGAEPATAPYGPTPIRGAAALAADPSRHRLLVGHFDGAPPRIEAYRPGQARIQATAALPFRDGALAVVGGRIWAVGFGAGGAVLTQLDPRTLQRDDPSPLERRLGPGAVLVADAGDRLLIRDGPGSPRLWCLDETGAVRHYWPAVSGTPVLTGSGVYVLAAGSALRHLASSGCEG